MQKRKILSVTLMLFCLIVSVKARPVPNDTVYLSETSGIIEKRNANYTATYQGYNSVFFIYTCEEEKIANLSYSVSLKDGHCVQFYDGDLINNSGSTLLKTVIGLSTGTVFSLTKGGTVTIKFSKINCEGETGLAPSFPRTGFLIQYSSIENQGDAVFDNVLINKTLQAKGKSNFGSIIANKMEIGEGSNLLFGARNELDITGSMAVSDKVGIGTASPAVELDVVGTIHAQRITIDSTTSLSTLDIATIVPNAIRIGKVGFAGYADNPFGATTTRFNIDFTGYRNINPDQVGARISAFRVNNWREQENNALVQITGLSFYTNPSGMNSGATDLVERMRIMPNGNIGIGTSIPSVKLHVIGAIRAEEVKVCLNQGCDFVFEKDYKLMPLQELNTFITTNKHLPEIAPAAEMESEGINLSEMNAKLLQKVEELTLYLLQQEEKIVSLQSQIDELKR